MRRNLYVFPNEVVIINLTAKVVKILTEEYEMEFIPDFETFQIERKTEVFTTLPYRGREIPISRVYEKKLKELPAPSPRALYIVSREIAEQEYRSDLLVPSGPIRDEAGMIIGYKSFEITTSY